MTSMTLIRGQATLVDLRAALDALGVRDGEAFAVVIPDTEARARTGDPSTSHSAAASVDDLKDKQKAVLTVFRRHGVPMTDETLVTLYASLAARHIVPEQAPSGIRSRRSELANGGLVVDTGQKEKLDSGRNAILWALAPEPEPEALSMFDAPPVQNGPRSAIGGLD